MKDIICFMREKEIFTVSEATQYLTVCPQTIYKLMHRAAPIHHNWKPLQD